MSAPIIELDPFVTLDVELRRIPIGTPPWGARSEVFFVGSATSPHWDGAWDVTGVDHIARGVTGTARIDVHVVITEPGAGASDDGDREVITYRGHGRGGPGGVIEGVTFETASERFGWLNESLAVGVATLDGDRLRVALHLVSV